MNRSTSYGPDKALVGFWALLCSPPAFIFAYLFAKSPTSDMATQFLFTLAFPLTPILFASRFRATFASSEFVYRRWGPTVRIPYSQIERIEVTNVTPVSKQPIGAFVVTTRGDRLPFWPKLFPSEAVNRFFALGG
jgi:hypothetical protein